MIINQGKSVAITYTLTLDNGETVDSNVDGKPLRYTQGSEEIIAGLEQALEGRRAGETFQVSIEPENGYGVLSEEAYIQVPLQHLPEEARQIGAVLTAKGPQGQELQGVITEVSDAMATLNFNHPLAGEVLHFEVTVVQVEEA
ncbi:FKBP-type peptidyl-prolyl cis-trans isomerase [Desulfobulbus alkaliphilus]|uniref:FKBP-type peptidyl-prolyl cis-trans isomerase n=1 Tax=Desulfobulbus alkaliphilus TaxID=869814 RepID=UPI00196616C3|nr:FKBP-type peptidyl-prolyl cis-trans isomerase [Desulfobulbus alkaliphilus]MBM9536717.1 FKBP-type peptidyl-prolyl cis-trans isomerase [Desulfobulbus alkaliphilus]